MYPSQNPALDCLKRYISNEEVFLDLVTGEVFRGIDVTSLNIDKIPQLQSKLRILSGLYGVLKPLDLIQPYRLEMGTKLINSNGNNLYKFWGNKINEYLKDDLNENTILVNLASNEYYKSINSIYV